MNFGSCSVHVCCLKPGTCPLSYSKTLSVAPHLSKGDEDELVLAFALLSSFLVTFE